MNPVPKQDRLRRVAIDVQHRGRPFPHKNDRGARFHDSADRTRWESDLAANYARGIAGALGLVGFSVLSNYAGADAPPVGRYSERARAARDFGATLFLACHVNAGAGRYARLGIAGDPRGDLRARDSLLYATSIAVALHKMPPIQGAEVHRYRALEWGGGTIRPAAALGMPAVLLEPYFGDYPAHLAAFGTFDGGLELGRTIAQAIIEAQRDL